MLQCKASRIASICDGVGRKNYFHNGRAFLPFLAVMLLAAPQLAVGQSSLPVTVAPDELKIDEGGSAGEYTVKLDAPLATNVTVTMDVVGAGDAVTVTETLSFDSNNWSTEQTVSVAAEQDDDAVDEVVTLTHTATITTTASDGTTKEEVISVRNPSVTVTVDDDESQTVTVTALTPAAVPEAGRATYTVALTTEPTAPVTVDIGGTSGEISVSPSRLVFDSTDYNTAQTVTVFAGEDLDAENDTATLTHDVRGGDYTGVSANDVSVTVTDNDTRGVTVSDDTLNIAAGARGTFSIVLNSRPTNTVRITVPEAVDNFSVSPSSLSFTSSNWNRPQTVTVVVGSNFDNTSTPTVRLENAITASGSRDMNYDNVDVADVVVTISDPATGVRLSRSSLTIDEGGDAEYTVRLAANPGEDQSVTLSVNIPANSGFTRTDTSTLTFAGPTSGNDPATWNTAQTVTLAAADDDNAVQETATITHTTAAGAIVANGILQATVRESDTRGITITPTSLEVTEGGTARYNIVLKSSPVGDTANRVTVNVGGVSGDVTVNPSQLVFTGDIGGTAGTWQTAQEVVVSAARDDDGDTDAPVTLSHTVAGGDYDRLRADNVRVTIKETDTRGIVVDTSVGVLVDGADPLTSSLTIDEGMTATYGVKLGSKPTGTVTVRVVGMSGDVSVSPSSLTFTTGDWNDWKMVEVKAGQDDDADQDSVVTLKHAASGGGYSTTSGAVTVTIREDERPGAIVTPRALTVTEGGAARSYTVVLTTEPSGTVTITLGGLAAARAQSLVVSPTLLTFTRGNWNVPQPVTVRAAEDDDATSAERTAAVELTHTARGGGYDVVTPLSVSVTVKDNDSASIIVSTPSLQMAQGTRRTYTLVLGSKPAANVDVAISSAPTGVTVSPASPVTFTEFDWSNPRTMTVHAASDATAGTATLDHSHADYDDASISLEIKDSSMPGVAINPTSLEITEGSSASYTVVLTSAPTATVNVEVSGAKDDVRVSRTRLSFSTGNWNREQSVTVSVSEDDDAVPEPAVTLAHKTTGAAEYEDTNSPVVISSVRVTAKENDMAGVTATPTSLTVAAGSSGTYGVRLTSEPLGAITVTVNSTSDDVTVTGSPVVIMPADWRTEHTVTVSVAATAGKDTEQSFTLTHTVTGDTYYSNVATPTVTINVPVEGAPSTPRGLSARSGDQSVTLTWTAPAETGGSAIVRYEVRYQEDGGTYGAWSTVAGGGTATSTTVGNLENGKSYEFQVRAVNSVAPGQPATTTASLVESAPGAPTNLTATVGSGRVALSWGAPADGGSQITRYEYRYAASGEDWSDWATADGAGNARSATISNLTNGTLYGFQVRAVNNLGEGEASQVTATPGSAPGAPTNLAARSGSETITVTWDAPAADGGASIRSYQLRYRMNGSGWSNWMTVNGAENGNSYTLTGLSNGIGHEIEVRAVNAIGSGPAASVEATPMEGMDFAHFANGPAGGVIITSDIVLVNVETSAVTPAIYFYDHEGEMIDADSVVDLTGDLAVAADGALTVSSGIPGRGEMTISTHGEGDFVRGSVRVFGTGRLGGVLRFDIPAIGVAGVGASEPVSDAIFPVRRMARGINTGVAVRNLSAQDMTVTCMLMQGGQVMDTTMIELPGDGQNSQFIDEMFPGANTVDFVGSVRCTAADGGMFVGVALELDAANGIFTTLPVVSLDKRAGSGESTLNFAHFANGDFGGTATTSDLVFVNVANSAVTPAIHFFDQMGNMIDASMVVDAEMDGVEVAAGALMVTAEIAPLGEMTISTSGMGDGRVGSVRVVSDGPIGGVLRFDIPGIGVAGVGASEAMNAAIYPARRMTGGINTGAAIRNLMADMTTVTCRLMAGGVSMGEAVINLAGNGQNSQFINELFPNANTSNFEGTVRCIAPSGSTFTGVALEMDFNNGIFTTLPVVPVR